VKVRIVISGKAEAALRDVITGRRNSAQVGRLRIERTPATRPTTKD
jgi:hypothetical protein